jgi:hypothetical protein
MTGGPIAAQQVVSAVDLVSRKETLASYVVWFDGTNYHADSMTGGTDYSGTSANTIIQNALTAVPSGSSIFIKNAGTANPYVITGSGTIFTIPSNGIGIYSDGATLKYNSAGSGNVFFALLQTDIRISGLIFNGTSGTEVTGTEGWGALLARGCQRVTVDHCGVSHHSGGWLNAASQNSDHSGTRSSDILFQANYSMDTIPSTAGFFSFTECDRAILADNYVAHSFDTVTTVARTTKGVFRGNVLTGKAQCIQLLQQANSDVMQDVVIADNSFTKDTTSAGNALVEIDDVTFSGTYQNIIVANNSFAGAPGSGGAGLAINVNGPETLHNIQIIGNSFRNLIRQPSFTYGITISGGNATPPMIKGVQIVGNYFGFIDGYAIQCGKTSGTAPILTRAIVADNIFESNGNALGSNAAVQMYDTTKSLFARNIFFDDQGVPTQTSAFLENAFCDSNIFENNDFGSGLTTIFSGLPTNEIRRNNRGYNPAYSSTGNTGAVSNAINFTPGPFSATYRIFASVDVTAWTTPASFTIVITYKDASGNARAETLALVRGSTGATATAITAVDRWYAIAPLIQIDNSGTAITLSTTGTFTGSPVYNLAASPPEQVA